MSDAKVSASLLLDGDPLDGDTLVRPVDRSPTKVRRGSLVLDLLGDEELIAQSREGSSEAFEVLWRRHAESGRRVAARFTRASDPDDLVQEAYLRIFAVLSRGKGPDGAFRPYLYQVIRNIAISWAAKPHAESIDMLPERSDGTDMTEAVLEGTVTAKAFRKLPERWQAILWYSEVEGMEPSEIAPLLGIKPTAVSALAYRAREGLRREWLQVHVNVDSVPDECRWAAERMGDSNRKGLRGAAKRRFDEHVASCTRCMVLVDEVEEVSRKLGLILVPLVVGLPWATFSILGTATAATVAGAGAAGAKGAVGAGASAATGGSGTGVSAAGASVVAASWAGPATLIAVASVAVVAVVGVLVVNGGLLRDDAQAAVPPQASAATSSPTRSPHDMSQVTDDPAQVEGDQDDPALVDPAQLFADLAGVQPSGVSTPDQATDPASETPGQVGATAVPTGLPQPTGGPAPRPTSAPAPAPTSGPALPAPVVPAPDPTQPGAPAPPVFGDAPVDGAVLTTYPTITGTALPNATVRAVSTAGRDIASATADASGRWSLVVNGGDRTEVSFSLTAETDGGTSATTPARTYFFLAPTTRSPANGELLTTYSSELRPGTNDVVEVTNVYFSGLAGNYVEIRVDGVTTQNKHYLGGAELGRGIADLPIGTHTVGLRYVSYENGAVTAVGRWTNVSFTHVYDPGVGTLVAYAPLPPA